MAVDFNQVLPTVYVGSFPQTPRDIDRLDRELGITGVLNVQTDEDYAIQGCDWESLADYYASKSIEVRRVPIVDFDSEDLSDCLPEAVQALGELLRAKHLVYVHCTLGVSRSSTVVVAYLHWIIKLGLEEAMDHVLHCRRCLPDIDAVIEATKQWAVSSGQ